jgi:hypothetical protein
MAKKKNAKPMKGVTGDGIEYTLQGNEVKICNISERIGIAPLNLTSENIATLTLADYYDRNLNRVFAEFNPGKFEDDVLFFEGTGKEKGLIGTNFVVFNQTTNSTDTLHVFRETVGDLMEMIYAVAHIGTDFKDKKGDVYKFGTVYGVNEVFLHFMELMDSCEDMEPLRRILYYTAGAIKGVCSCMARNSGWMLEIIDEVSLKIMHLKKESEEDGRNDS